MNEQCSLRQFCNAYGMTCKEMAQHLGYTEQGFRNIWNKDTGANYNRLTISIKQLRELNGKILMDKKDIAVKEYLQRQEMINDFVKRM